CALRKSSALDKNRRRSPRVPQQATSASPSEKDGDPMTRRLRFSVCAALLGIVFFAQLTEGQAQTNLVINGIVQDQTGAAFFGARVDLLKDGEQQRTITTDVSGAFRFDKVQPGNYEVRTQKEGFKTDISKITVGTRSTGRLRIILSIETLNQQITVNDDTADLSTDASENRDVAAVDRQALDNLPIFDQDIVATMSRFLDSSSLGTNGVTLIVDGIQGAGAFSASAIQ